jgi:hypothetical protein
MTYARRTVKHRPDGSAQQILEGLRKMGVKCYPLGWPVDVFLLYWSSKHQSFLWTPMEFKALLKSGKPKRRSDQPMQDVFIKETGCPVVASLDQAVAWLKEH